LDFFHIRLSSLSALGTVLASARVGNDTEPRFYRCLDIFTSIHFLL